MERYDVIIVGTGRRRRHARPAPRALRQEDPAARARRLAAARAENWSAEAVFVDNRYVSPDTWYDEQGKAFQPQIHYFVGGATKLYGAALYRLRPEDFGELRHHDGISPAWPIGYDELEPYYTQAEQVYEVHGNRGEDPTEAPSSGPYPFPAVSHEPRIQQLSDALEAPATTRSTRRAGSCSTRRTCRSAPACAARTATASRASCTASRTRTCSACARRSSTRTSRC